MASAAPMGAAGSFRLDLLRLFLVAQVMLGHLAMLAYPSFGLLDLGQPHELFIAFYRLVTRFGAQAAVVFVAMSGFFLVPRLVAITRSPQEDGLATFLGGRLRRVYPTLVAALALTALCDAWSTALPGGRDYMRSTVAFDLAGDASWQTALANLLSLQPTFAPSFGSNGPLWTLGYIVQFYVIGALLAAIWRKSRPAVLVLLAALAVAAGVWLPEWLVLFGAWAGCGLLGHWRCRRARAIGVVLAVGAVLFIASETLPQLPALFVAALSSLPLLVGLASAWPGDARCHRVVPLVLREATFPLYAFHFPLALLLMVLLLPWRAAAPAVFTFAWPVLALALVLPLSLGWQVLLARLTRKGAA